MPERLPVPPVDYSSKDWATLRDDMESAITTRLPEWTSRSPNDFGIVLIELFAYVGDILSFYGDRIANEAFLPTAVLRSSVLNIAKMLDYRPTENLAAVTVVTFTTVAGNGQVTVPALTKVGTVAQEGLSPIIFETDEELVIEDTPPNQGQVTVSQGVTVANEAVGTSDGGLDQVYLLFGSPVIEASQTIFVDEGSGASEWLFFPNLIDAGADDNAYTTQTDENGILNVIFGDNVNGRIPASGAAITATYRVGGGTVGNVGANKLVALLDSVANVASVTNASLAEGGTNAETLDEIRENAPRSLVTIDRAVTLEDYAALSLKVAGIAKAKAQAQVYTNVNLYIAPSSGSEDPVASANLKAQVQDYIDQRKMVNATVTLLDPTYVDIDITAEVHVLPPYNREVVRLDVEKAVKSVLAYENSIFGDRVTLSEVYQAMNGVRGVDYGVVFLLVRKAVFYDGVLDETTTLLSDTATFTADDVGNAVVGAGIPLDTTIVGYTSPTEVTMSAASTVTASDVIFEIGRPGLADVQVADNEIPSIGTVTITATGGIVTL